VPEFLPPEAQVTPSTIQVGSPRSVFAIGGASEQQLKIAAIVLGSLVGVVAIAVIASLVYVRFCAKPKPSPAEMIGGDLESSPTDNTPNLVTPDDIPAIPEVPTESLDVVTEAISPFTTEPSTAEITIKST